MPTTWPNPTAQSPASPSHPILCNKDMRGILAMGEKGVNGWRLRGVQADMWLGRRFFMKHKREFPRFFSHGVDGVENLGLPNEFLFDPVFSRKIQKQNPQDHCQDTLSW